ncbi:3-coathanger stack domain-containing protein [Emticicia sp. 17c]|uniref:3-coathanger stack domain-containing protein n=1 Tax=Emticicia sp. 17c TaxID=3127704 RepID=UPI00301E3604
MLRICLLFICLLSGCGHAMAKTVFTEDSLRYFLDNSVVRIGFDKRMGGAVSYFARCSNGINLINNHDAGRQAGFETRIYPDDPVNWRPYANAKYLTDVYPYAGGASREWNGLPQGSFYNQYFNNKDNLGGLPVEIKFDENTEVLYIKSKLWEWGFVKDSAGVYKKIDAGAYNEYWISLEGISAHFSVKQTRNIPYFVSNTNVGVSLHIFINLNYSFVDKWQTYNDSSPYTHQPVAIRTDFPLNEPNFANFWTPSTENWAAMTNQQDYGMGIYTDDKRFTFLYGEKQFGSECAQGGFSCPDEDRYSFALLSFSTYSFPCGEPCTTPDNSSTLNFSFMAGHITEMRQFAYDKHTQPCSHGVILSSVNDDLKNDITKTAKIFIEANNKVINSAIRYESGRFITLNPGFEVKSGASFSASIKTNPCN